jgi:hypothetical protein
MAGEELIMPWLKYTAKFQNIQEQGDRPLKNSLKRVGNTFSLSSIVTNMVIYGDPETVLNLFGKSTAYIERTHLTMRLFNGRLVRQTLAFSKDVQMYRWSAAWEDLVYNFARPLKTLRIETQAIPGKRWIKRSPAMAAKLTDHIWSVKELLTTVPLPNT